MKVRVRVRVTVHGSRGDPTNQSSPSHGADLSRSPCSLACEVASTASSSF